MHKRKNILFGFAAIVSFIPLLGFLKTKKQPISSVNDKVNNTPAKGMLILSIKDSPGSALTEIRAIIPDSAYNTIFLKLKNIIVNKLGVDSSEVKPEAKIKDDLGADSLDVVELVMEVEKFYSISIPDKEYEKINTVNDLVLLVYKINGNKK